MIVYLVRRVGQSLLAVMAMAVLVFLGVFFIGNPVDVLVSPEASQAQIAVKGVPDEDAELFIERPVQAQPFDGGGDLGLARLGADQHIDGIADEEDAEEDQHGHGH
ncbi:MAG: hypothetical protein ACO1OA_04970, partial [Paracoccus marcusii]